MTGAPPSWRPSPGYDGQLELARGALRDSMGGLSNLDQLLRSVRVGPKALATVIPDVHASCVSMRQTWESIIDALEVQLPTDHGAIESLREFVRPRVLELGQALAVDRPLNARGRLGLEQVVAQHLAELDAARGLADLLVSASWGASVTLELTDVVHQAFQSGSEPDWSPPESVTATLDSPRAQVELSTNANAVVSLLALGVNLVDQQGASTPHISVRGGDTGPGLSVCPGPAEGDTIQLGKQRIIEPTRPCVVVAARILGARIALTEGPSPSFALVWPADQGPSC